MPRGCALWPSCGSSWPGTWAGDDRRTSRLLRDVVYQLGVRQSTNACRERMMAEWACPSWPRCLSGYKSFGSRRARRARFLRRLPPRSFACSGVDEPQFAGVGHQDLVAAPLQEPANPGRVGPGLDRDGHRRPLRSEASPEGLRGGAQSRPSSITSALSVSMRQR